MARRRYQRGSVILQGNVWYGRYRESVLGSDGREIRIRRSVPLGSKKEFPTKRLAERQLEVKLAPINSLTYRPGRVATVEEFAERWKREVLEHRRASTIHTQKSHLKIQIVPILGKLRLNDISVENQQLFVNRLSGTISRKMLVNVLSTLSSMLKTAKNWGYTCEGVDFDRLVLPAKTVKEEPISFTADQARSIICEAKGQFRVMFALAAMTGLRAGEILALQVGDFDFTKRILTVRRHVWRQKVSVPKTTTSQDVLPIPDVLVGIVREHIATLKSEWLFLNQRNKLFFAENVVEQALVPILDKLKLPRCGFHAFRHTHSTLLIENGATPKEAQEQLRHADPRVTIGLYSHANAESRRLVVERVASILDLNGPIPEPITQRIQ